MPEPSAPPRRSALLRGSIFLLALVPLGILLVLFVLGSGRVTGEEFAPSHFQSRSFRYWELPVLHWQLTAIERSSATPPLVRFLTSQGLLKPPPGAPTVWHLATVQAGPEREDLDPHLLLRALLGQGASPFDWEAWSKAHPAIAQQLWPRVQELAMAELYVLLPRVFQLAAASPNAHQFQTRLDQYLGDSFAELIEDWRAASQFERAESLRRIAAEEYPSDPRFAAKPSDPAPPRDNSSHPDPPDR